MKKSCCLARQIVASCKFFRQSHCARTGGASWGYGARRSPVRGGGAVSVTAGIPRRDLPEHFGDFRAATRSASVSPGHRGSLGNRLQGGVTSALHRLYTFCIAELGCRRAVSLRQGPASGQPGSARNCARNRHPVLIFRPRLRQSNRRVSEGWREFVAWCVMGVLFLRGGG